jgi:hypothetical protein
MPGVLPNGAYVVTPAHHGADGNRGKHGLDRGAQPHIEFDRHHGTARHRAREVHSAISRCNDVIARARRDIDAAVAREPVRLRNARNIHDAPRRDGQGKAWLGRVCEGRR